MNLLLVHPALQLGAIALSFYVAFLGLQRTRSLHLGTATRFKRNLHAGLGAAALVSMLAGIAGGLIMLSRLLGRQPLESLHGKIGMLLLPFILLGLFSGFSLYLTPPKGKLLATLHGFNNMVILLLALFQIWSGMQFYLHLLATR